MHLTHRYNERVVAETFDGNIPDPRTIYWTISVDGVCKWKRESQTRMRQKDRERNAREQDRVAKRYVEEIDTKGNVDAGTNLGGFNC